MKTIKKILLPVIMIVSLLAANVSTVYAAQPSSEKEEVIYVRMASDGEAREMYAVNIFTIDGGGTVIDYGSYSSVRCMTTQDTIEQSGDRITITTQSDKLYYEGVMDNAELPWKVTISYYLDGKEISAADLAGASGALAIAISIRENPKAPDGFYDSYALQVTASLDTKRCENITAPGATLANVGSAKQISYTVLPGRGLNAEICARVHDFEMDGIQINGVGLALDLDVDTSEVTDKLTDLQNGAAALDEGADSLAAGANRLVAGAAGIANGADKLCDGAGELYAGLDELEAGVQGLQSGLTEMKRGAAGIQTGLAALQRNSGSIRAGSAEVSLTLTQLKTAVSQFDTLLAQLETLAAGSTGMMSGINELYNGVYSLNANLSTIDTAALISANNNAIVALTQAESEYGIDMTSVKGVLNANNTAWQGVKQAQNAIAGENGLLAGAAKLRTDYKRIDDGIQSMNARLSDINTGLTALRSAINELESAYNDLQTGMNTSLTAYTEGVDAAAQGYAELYAALYGTDGVSEGADSLAAGIAEAHAASLELYEGASELNAAAAALDSGLGELNTGATELADGTQTLYDSTATMDADVNARIDEMITELTGSATAPVSFVSPKNTNIGSVQFVMTTDPIEIGETVVSDDVPETEKSLIERFLDLFR